jgi:transketolase
LRIKALPAGWDKDIPIFAPGKDVATRAASGQVINAIAKHLPEFWGGSSDLAGSNVGGFIPISTNKVSWLIRLLSFKFLEQDINKNNTK